MCVTLPIEVYGANKAPTGRARIEQPLAIMLLGRAVVIHFISLHCIALLLGPFEVFELH